MECGDDIRAGIVCRPCRRGEFEEIEASALPEKKPRFCQVCKKSIDHRNIKSIRCEPCQKAHRQSQRNNYPPSENTKRRQSARRTWRRNNEPGYKEHEIQLAKKRAKKDKGG